MPGSTASKAFRFGLPPSLGAGVAERSLRLERVLAGRLGRVVEIVVAPSYEVLAKDLLSGRTDASWAPPFVCARVEAMGVRILTRGVRRGNSVYRAALVGKASAKLTPNSLQGKTALWIDRDSVAGYLLPMAFLRSKSLEPGKLLGRQDFVGSYKAALEGILECRGDLTGIFAASNASRPEHTGIDDVLPGKSSLFSLIAVTDEAPNDGVAVSMAAEGELVATLERVLLTLHETTEGAGLLKELFNAERFEVAPRLGYRALYRVALASL